LNDFEISSRVPNVWGRQVRGFLVAAPGSTLPRATPPRNLSAEIPPSKWPSNHTRRKSHPYDIRARDE
jgi:hypothetical protein